VLDQLDQLDVYRLVGIGPAAILVYQLGKALVVWVQGRADVARIKAGGKVLIDLAQLESKPTEPPDEAAS
jgi:hypothetical protein